MKRIIYSVLAIGLLAGGVLSFNACSDKDEVENQVEKSYENEVQFPDGTYIGKLGDIVIECTFKNNILIERKVNGKIVDIQYAPKQIVCYNEQSAMACVEGLDNNGWPCISLYHIDDFPKRGDVNWIVEYSDYEADGSCWYDKYR